ncbi:MAG: hypothetical protein WAZ77_06345 [Candidatus Nitrosopolaris sp.]
MYNKNGDNAINNYGSNTIHPTSLKPSKSKYSSVHDIAVVANTNK